MSDTKISLDNASSVPVVFHQDTGAEAMEHEYEVEYKGRIVRCKTADAAAQLLHVLEQQDDDKDVLPWSPHDFTEFTDRIQWQQRRLLKHLLNYGGGSLSSKKLRELMDIVGNQSLAGVLSGVTKVAMSLDIAPERVYLKTTKFTQGKPEQFYRVASGFLWAAKEHEWPSDRDLEEPHE